MHSDLAYSDLVHRDLADSDLAYLDVALAKFDLLNPESLSPESLNHGFLNPGTAHVAHDIDNGLTVSAATSTPQTLADAARATLDDVGVGSQLRLRVQLAALGVVTALLCTLLFAWPQAVHTSAEIDAIGVQDSGGQRSVQSLAGWFDDGRRAQDGAAAPMQGQLEFSPSPAGPSDLARDNGVPRQRDTQRRAASAPYFAPAAPAKAAIAGAKADATVANEPQRSPSARIGDGDIEGSNRESAPSAPGAAASSSDSPADPEPSPVRDWATGDGRQHAGAALVEQIDFDLEAIGYSLSFEAPRESLLGLTMLDLQHIEIYARPGMTDAAILDVIGHEIGHAVDHMVMTPDSRLEWQIARGMNVNELWFPTTLDSDMATPAGDFAECFSWLLTKSPSYSAWGACDGFEETLTELTTN